ncbi:glycosyltransferase family 2 protein [Benzoatithermus flavus]
MPVRNGARYIAAAIESILAQTFTDFELVIADDDSSDGTAEICRAYAAKDARVRFHENGRKLGLAENHNRVVELARGRFFHWTGADDAHDPRFLECCLAALEETPDAILAYTAIRVIDEEGRELGIRENRILGSDDAAPARRLAGALLDCPWCSAMYGLFRLDALRRTSLMLPFHGSDRTLLVEAALAGRFVHVPEPLFLNREHAERYTANAERWHTALQSASRPKARSLPLWRGVASWLGAVARLVPVPRDRLLCMAPIVHWLVRWPNPLLLAWDVLAWLSPGLVARFWSWKRRRRLVGVLGRHRRSVS